MERAIADLGSVAGGGLTTFATKSIAYSGGKSIHFLWKETRQSRASVGSASLMLRSAAERG
jgi:hypothetical protein